MGRVCVFIVKATVLTPVTDRAEHKQDNFVRCFRFAHMFIMMVSLRHLPCLLHLICCFTIKLHKNHPPIWETRTKKVEILFTLSKANAKHCNIAEYYYCIILEDGNFLFLYLSSVQLHSWLRCAQKNTPHQILLNFNLNGLNGVSRAA